MNPEMIRCLDTVMGTAQRLCSMWGSDSVLVLKGSENLLI